VPRGFSIAGRRLLGVVLVAALAAVVVGSGAVAARAGGHGFAGALGAQVRPSAAACGETPGLQCSTVVVPLDRTGRLPGTVALHVEYLPAEGPQRGTVFLIAGGPGQGSAHVFGLGSPSSAQLYHYLFPGYALVAYDDRGTGASGLIDCPVLQRAITADQQQISAAGCATTIGAARDFYSTGEHAEDLDAVRASLGLSKIALFGVSYGTKLSLSYALAYPDRVERLLLDSVLPPELPDPYSAEVLRALPGTLSAFCADASCRAATPNFADDVVAVANAYAVKPLAGKVLEPNGKTVTQRVDGIEFLGTLLDADINPGLAAELPAAVHAARHGNTQPLLRLARLHDLSTAQPAEELSNGLYAATVCHDGPFPWDPNTPVGSRPPLYQAAVNGLPSGTLGPFGKWAARFGNADFCLRWPSPAGGAPFGPGPLPDVPLLAISGGFDMRTPTANAVSVVARFPHGHLLLVPGVGHSVTTADPSGCAANAVRAWFQTGAVPAPRCPRGQPFVRALSPLPAAKTPVKLGPLATYAIALKTIREAQAAWLMASDSPVAGIYSGKLAPGRHGFTLTRYAIARGVELSGTFRLVSTDLPVSFQGTVKVGGASASTGILGLSRNSLKGTLGGRLVG
jgi:pimeloyl-ACP methyl ester carboxylesterase